MPYNNFYTRCRKARKPGMFYWGIRGIGKGKYLENASYPFRWTVHKGDAVLFHDFTDAKRVSGKLQNVELVLIKIPEEVNNGKAG